VEPETSAQEDAEADALEGWAPEEEESQGDDRSYELLPRRSPPILRPPSGLPLGRPWGTPSGQRVDQYTDRLLKYLPAESVALYLTLQGIVLSSGEGGAPYAWLWFVFVVGIIGTPLYLWRIQHVSKIAQLAVSTAAFGVWVFALGGAFASLSWYKPFLGSMLLVIFTFFVPLISPDVLSSEEAA
jgi:hypothetical protein